MPGGNEIQQNSLFRLRFTNELKAFTSNLLDLLQRSPRTHIAILAVLTATDARFVELNTFVLVVGQGKVHNTL